MEDKQEKTLYLQNFLNMYREGIKENSLKDDLARYRMLGYKTFVIRMERSMEGLSEEDTATFAEAVNALRQEGLDCRFQDGFTPEQALEASRKVSSWVDEINNARVDGQELSPFEKFLYAYEIATNFVYKLGDKNEEGKEIDPYQSRNLVRVLTGDRIVCVGFSFLLKELCTRLDIACATFSLPGKTKDELGHCTCLAYLKDPKYDINGTFFTDPTQGSINGTKRDFSFAVKNPSKFIEQFKDRFVFDYQRTLEQLITPRLSPEEKREYQHYIEAKNKMAQAKENVEKNIALVESEEFLQKVTDIIDAKAKAEKVTPEDEMFYQDFGKQILDETIERFSFALTIAYQESAKQGSLEDKFLHLFENAEFSPLLLKAQGMSIKSFVQAIMEKTFLYDKEFIASLSEETVKPSKKVAEMQQEMPTLSDPDGATSKISRALYNVGLAQNMSQKEAIVYTYSRLFGFTKEQQEKVLADQTQEEVDEFLRKITPREATKAPDEDEIVNE